MNKRSAMLVAAGLVLTLVVGGIAVGVGLTGPEIGSARPRSGRERPSPIVKTTTKTVTVHRKSDASTDGGAAVPGTSSSSLSSAYGSSDDAYVESESDEDEFGDDEFGEHEGVEDNGGSDDDGGSGAYEDD
jgi:hypothetical protein